MPRLLTLGLLILAACASPAREDRGQPRAWPERIAPPHTPAPEQELPADLEGWLARALEHNPALRAAHHSFQAALERVDQVESLPDPSLTWSEFVDELQTRTGPQSRRLMLMQSFPWPGVLRTRGEAAAHRAEVLWFAALAQALDVRREVEVAWYELAWLTHAERVRRDALTLLQQLEPVVQRRIETGGLQEDLLRLQMEIAVVDEKLAELADRRAPLRAQLAAALGLRDLPNGVQPVLVEPVPQRRTGETLAALALEHSPRLQALGEDVARLRSERELADLRRYPDFTVGLEHMQVDPAVMPGTPGSGEDPLMLRLGVSLPIWTSNYDAAEREAGHALRAAQLQLDDAANRLSAEVHSALFRFDDAGRDLALYRNSLLPRARETYDLTLSSYRAGAASLLDLIDSERLTIDFELQYWNACRDVLQQEARLRALVGGSLE